MAAIRRYLGLVFWIAAIGALGGHCLVFADDKQEFDELWKRADAITSQKNPGAVLEFMDRLQLLAERLDARFPPKRASRKSAVGSLLVAAGIDASVGGHYAESAAIHSRALAILDAVSGPESEDVANSLKWQAMNFKDWSHYREAETTAIRALRLYEKVDGSESENSAICLWILGDVYRGLDNCTEAEQAHQRSLAIREKNLGQDHARVADSLNNLALVYYDQGRYTEAEAMFRRALSIRERELRANEGNALAASDAASSLTNLANVYGQQGRHAEAQPLRERALAMYEKAHGHQHPFVANGLNSLAITYGAQGRYAEAEMLYKRALAIQEQALEPDHPAVAVSAGNLANVYRAQGRYAEAERLYQRALTINEKSLGPNHSMVAWSLEVLAHVYRLQRRYAEAEPLLRRALAIQEKVHGAQHNYVADCVRGLASLYAAQGRYAEAEPLYSRSLAIYERVFGPDHPAVASSLQELASSYFKRGMLDRAERLLDRGIAIGDRAGAAPGERFQSYELRAQIAWKLGRRTEALADLRHALDLAEQQRGHISGTEHERAESFAAFAPAFECMVAWQAELGDAGEAFQAIERAHARSLLDEIGMAGADLAVGRTLAEREQLRQREGELRAQASGLEKKLAQAKDDEARNKLQTELAAARAALYEHYRDERSTSPIYRNLLSVGAGPPRLSQVQRRLPADSLLLAFLLGEDESFVLVAGPGSARVVKLVLAEPDARVLGITAGPVTAKRLQTVLIGENRDGLLARLADVSAKTESVTSRLASLWRLVIPEPERKAILTGKVKQIAIIPDGPLALLPFEVLVVEEGKEPKYLLDAGPPIVYAPSATVLYNLAERPQGKPVEDREPVLAVGDPAYGTRGAADPTPATTLAALTPQSRYSTVGGNLNRLPYSGLEAQWVVKQFNDAGIDASSFSGATATERGLRYWCPGRRILHLACHGLADQQFGNFFGALALTPGPKGSEDPTDDGFLTLPEIYELNLKGFELAILSACQTNYGPQQKGEGTWALSRGFLVAGCRRVVASNWLVDDEAAATLVSYFCAGLAKAQKAGKPVDHAAALQAAKRLLRQQGKWKSPYYWASMVLIGPA
jgi:CHAT domain-containing protein/lipopolysaccharide biosynthesis regulator YciM